MNSDIADIVRWAQANGWEVHDDASGYTRFVDPGVNYIPRIPPRRATRGDAWRT